MTRSKLKKKMVNIKTKIKIMKDYLDELKQHLKKFKKNNALMFQ